MLRPLSLSDSRARDAMRWGLVLLAVLPAVIVPLTGLTYRIGAPHAVVRAVGFVPDVLVVGMIVSGGAVAIRQRQRPDTLDLVVGALAAVVAVVLLLGLVLRVYEVELPLRLQVLGARAMLAGFLVMVAVRSVRLRADDRDRVADVVLGVGLVLAGDAVIETAFPNAWESFGTVTLKVREYQEAVYHLVVPENIVIRTPVAGRSLVRAGSLLFEYLQLGFLLLPALAIALARAARRPRVGSVLAVALVGAGIAATLGRTIIAVTGVVAVVVAVTRPDRTERRRLLQAVGAVAIVVILVSIPTGLAVRMLETVQGSEASTDIHLESTRAAVELVADRPLGVGLGRGFAASARDPGRTLLAENAYLDVAIQVGLVGLAAFVALVVVLWRSLWRARPWDDAALAAVAGVVGLTLGGLLLHTWQMLETSWLVLGLAGLALPRQR